MITAQLPHTTYHRLIPTCNLFSSANKTKGYAPLSTLLWNIEGLSSATKLMTINAFESYNIIVLTETFSIVEWHISNF
jgi:hypothetical protein